MASSEEQLQGYVNRCQELMAHAWVVRAFLRHADEIEDYPELTNTCRAIFDIARALETRVDDSLGYFKMLNKKLGKFRVAVEQFSDDVTEISTHTNYSQSLISLRACIRELEETLSAARIVAQSDK